MKGTGRERGFACGIRGAEAAVIQSRNGQVRIYASEGARRLFLRLRRALVIIGGILAALTALRLLLRGRR